MHDTATIRSLKTRTLLSYTDAMRQIAADLAVQAVKDWIQTVNDTCQSADDFAGIVLSGNASSLTESR
jgi:hypothetical protein